MATQKNCDVCKQDGVDEPAVDTVKMGGGTLTELVLDVCEKHLAEYKAWRRKFSGQERD